MGMLLDPARPQPVPIGSLVRSIALAPARHWLVWPDARLRPARGLAGTDPRSVAAYLDEPAIAHFARELDEVAVRTAMTDQGDGPVDVHVVECAVAGGYGGDTTAADAVTAWIAETIRRGIPKGSRRAAVPRAPGRRPPEPARRAPAGVPMALTANPPAASLKLADDARQARATAPAQLQARPRLRRRAGPPRYRTRRRAPRPHERLTLPPTERNRPPGRRP